jgi:hypothetical protein
VRGRAAMLQGLDVYDVLAAVAVWVLLTAASLAVVLRVILVLPEDHFERSRGAPAPWTLSRLARNGAGLLLILIGAVLSVPGVPGQGVLTMLVGVLLVDFPRRARLERFLLRRPGVLDSLNRLRARFGHPPLRPPPA